MPITIQYSSRRGEVWTQYWRLWRQKLWRFHAALFVVVTVGLLVGLSGWQLSPAALAGIAVLGGLLPCVAFALYPLAKFKPQTRVLTIDQAGLTTSIGKRYGEAPWPDVDAIVDQQELIVIRRTNGNAFVIPARAFASPADRAAFLSAAREARAATLKP
jgi:hypothetical protein